MAVDIWSWSPIGSSPSSSPGVPVTMKRAPVVRMPLVMLLLVAGFTAFFVGATRPGELQELRALEVSNGEQVIAVHVVREDPEFVVWDAESTGTAKVLVLGGGLMLVVAMWLLFSRLFGWPVDGHLPRVWSDATGAIWMSERHGA